MNPFRKSKPETDSTPTRSAATIRALLEVAQNSLPPLTEKLSIAQAEMTQAQRLYDAGVQAFALGESQSEPNRGDLQALVTRADALRRVMNGQEQTVRQLSGELADAELREVTAEERGRLPLVIGCGEARLNEYEQALVTLKKAEASLLDALFNRSGLKMTFTDAEIAREATRARKSLGSRAMQLAERFKYPPSARLETDGLDNWGAEENPLSFMFRFFRA